MSNFRRNREGKKLKYDTGVHGSNDPGCNHVEISGYYICYAESLKYEPFDRRVFKIFVSKMSTMLDMDPGK